MIPPDSAGTLEKRVETLEIQLAWQSDLLTALDRTVAELNRELFTQQRRFEALQEELRRQRALSGAPLPHEKPPHY